jgi:molybdopterin converting factor small subunit
LVEVVRIKVEYYGVARVMVRKPEESLEVKTPTTLLELIQLIAKLHNGSLGTYLIDPATLNVRAHPALTYLVNGQLIPYHEVANIFLEDGSTVSIIPTQAG